jgi:N-sulfoglucosamine sulfohydrolase
MFPDMVRAAGRLAAVFALLTAAVLPARGGGKPAPLNFLLITADDMNCDSVGVYGCRVPGVTPNIDRLASQGLRFRYGNVTVPVCMPTRAVWMTGRYPHRNGARGFENIRSGIPTLPEELRKAGYTTGIMAKVEHVIPDRKAFDTVVPGRELGQGRSPELYHQHARAFFRAAKEAGKPFFLMANSQDPHRPFAGSDQERRFGPPGTFPPVRDPYQPDQVPVPRFLPELPEVRREMAEYFTSVRRADRTVGEVLRALEEEGLADRTLVMFLSDHGMALPFAKTNVYLHSSRTPWIVRWPGVVRPGQVDDRHFVSGIDLAPTVLEALGLPPLEGADGRSFLPLLQGKSQDGREFGFVHFWQTAARQDFPMRSVQDHRFGYIYNAWSDGTRIFRNESQSGRTWPAMRRAAATDPAIAARVKLFQYRVPEELYDYEKDPDALHNLVDDPQYAPVLQRQRQRMLEHLSSTEDPLLPSFRTLLEGKLPADGKENR